MRYRETRGLGNKLFRRRKGELGEVLSKLQRTVLGIALAFAFIGFVAWIYRSITEPGLDEPLETPAFLVRVTGTEVDADTGIVTISIRITDVRTGKTYPTQIGLLFDDIAKEVTLPDGTN